MEPRTYVSRILAVEAMRFNGTGESARAIADWAEEFWSGWRFTSLSIHFALRGGGKQELPLGYFLIRDESGVFSVCGPAAFAETYRVLEEVVA